MTIVRFIAGSGRSGTTWVQDALADANGLRPVFEPLHSRVSDIGARYAYRALAAYEEHPELRQFLEEVCAGRRQKLWTKYRRQTRWLFPPIGDVAQREQRKLLVGRWWKFAKELPRLHAAGRRNEPLVKCIRANLMLGWLIRWCNCRIVLIVRHPGAVIESELRGHWDADFVLGRFRADSRLREMAGDRYEPLFARRLSAVQALAARWVIENQLAIEQVSATQSTVVHYEHLKSAPAREWRRICDSLDLRNVPSSDALARPSQQAAAKLSEVSGDPTGEPGWMKRLTTDQIEAIQEVLTVVGFDLYSMYDLQPRLRAEAVSRPPRARAAT